ncbi:hypothetical protein CY34DRAFT_798726 [Suillus luteus UH-Slu-Lm8-n1]|uniref:Secreted protein n=1 Tax=Suillus luteus UH-Slu-Lm8-n1 TaxID=930992 RepID=A0A0D0BQW5_9AGAM|nr:hypothetical protein CY34DRAFT_798726 [Suillus luteus UH-Slu-Lm8-n1]
MPWVRFTVVPQLSTFILVRAFRVFDFESSKQVGCFPITWIQLNLHKSTSKPKVFPPCSDLPEHCRTSRKVVQRSKPHNLPFKASEGPLPTDSVSRV